jgi:hypothetical protein
VIKKRDISKVVTAGNPSVKRNTVSATNKELTVLIFVNVKSARMWKGTSLVHLNTCLKFQKRISNQTAISTIIKKEPITLSK